MDIKNILKITRNYSQWGERDKWQKEERQGELREDLKE